MYDSQSWLIPHFRYWKEPYFKALKEIKEVSEKHKLTLTEVALRWISHHSLLKREHGDAILIGASSLKHIEEVRPVVVNFVSNVIDSRS